MLKPAHILLPNANVDLQKWATLACDQFTSQAEYWQEAEKITKGVPSALHIILPEVYLEQADVTRRIADIHTTMQTYAQKVLTNHIDGYMYIERTMESGVVRQGLVGAVDLEDYTFEKGAKPLIRPSENTVVERIPPRLAVRRDALLESPHIMMLIDDEKCGVIEEIARRKGSYDKAYDTDLMLGGGHI
ncbi:MAG: DUF1015 family protein, partial [Oscillospiraceae bacterium]|nr:DUF1015 family protein [Oscillospiraceae bacterium]